MPENFTDQEWKEYLEKIKQLKPFNDKEFEEFLNARHLGRDNPNYEFYQNPPKYSSILNSTHKRRTIWKSLREEREINRYVRPQSKLDAKEKKWLLGLVIGVIVLFFIISTVRF